MRHDLLLFLTLLCLTGFSCTNSTDDPMSTNPDPDDLPLALDLGNCPLTVSGNTLEVLTWNIEDFPKSNRTIEILEEVITTYDPDVIAVQEITSLTDFYALVNGLGDWEGTAVRYNGSNLMLGFLYKPDEVIINEDVKQLFEESTSMNNTAFTAFRRPLLLNITHRSSGLQSYLINIHLKCCNGSEDRRRAATALLKNYIDTELPDDNVIVLGDFNDELVDTDNVFQAWIDDTNNYRFTTFAIAEGPDTEWSLPGFPSMIDHVLITNELFDNETSTSVVTLDRCFDGAEYERFVSDHRPVFISLEGN